MTKIFWKMSDKPTGRFKSFQHRSWPMATFHDRDGPTAASMVPQTPQHKGYDASYKETAVLRVRVADYRSGGNGFDWRYLSGEFVGFTACKEAFAKFIAETDSWVIPPPDEKPAIPVDSSGMRDSHT